MAESLLSLDTKLAKEFDMSDDFKLAFVKAQLDEMKKVLWRTRIDSIISQKQMESDDENVVAESTRLHMQYKNQIKQMVTSIGVYQGIIKELEG